MVFITQSWVMAPSDISLYTKGALSLTDLMSKGSSSWSATTASITDCIASTASQGIRADIGDAQDKSFTNHLYCWGHCRSDMHGSRYGQLISARSLSSFIDRSGSLHQRCSNVRVSLLLMRTSCGWLKQINKKKKIKIFHKNKTEKFFKFLLKKYPFKWMIFDSKQLP